MSRIYKMVQHKQLQMHISVDVKTKENSFSELFWPQSSSNIEKIESISAECDRFSVFQN